MANTFQEMSHGLRLFVPQLPITLAEHFVRDRYRKILERRDWSATRKEAEFILHAAKTTGTVAITREDDEVTGTGTSFDDDDVGRQFKVGQGSPIYTITAVDPSDQVLTLDRPFGGATVTAAAYYVFDGYVTPPDDFLRFLSVADPLQGNRVNHWVTEQEISSMDPMRTFFGQPYALAARVFGTGGMPQYEAWPYTATDRTLYYIYMSRVADLIDESDEPIWPIRSDVIVTGALADAARWPGTAQSPNPYFKQPSMWKTYEAEFEDKMIDIERRDEEIYIMQLQQWPYAGLPMAPLGASFTQAHLV